MATPQTATVIQILETWSPSLKSQENLRHFLKINDAFGFVEDTHLKEIAKIARMAQEMLSWGDADLEVTIRDGKVITRKPGKRERD